MKRARDVREQLESLLERVEIEPSTNLQDSVAIRKVLLLLLYGSTAVTDFNIWLYEQWHKSPIIWLPPAAYSDFNLGWVYS